MRIASRRQRELMAIIVSKGHDTTDTIDEDDWPYSLKRYPSKCHEGCVNGCMYTRVVAVLG